MIGAARKDKPIPYIAVIVLTGLLYLALSLPTLQIVYRLYLFCTKCGFFRNLNHVDAVVISETWAVLGAVLFASVVLWFFAKLHQCSRYVVPVMIASATLLALFYGMRIFGVLITYEQYVLGETL